MDMIEILLTVTLAGFALNFATIAFMWRHFDKRFEKVDQRFEKVDQRFDKVDQRFEKIEALVLDIDRRLCRIEGGMAAKDCCMLKDNRTNEKAN